MATALRRARRPERPPTRACDIPFDAPSVRPSDVAAAVRALRAGTLSGDGPIGRAVEARLRALLGVRHALLVNSCTAALEIALRSVGVHGGNVIMPSFSFPSVAATVASLGGRPVFADIDPVHLCLDGDAVARALTRRTRAVVHVDYGGSPGGILAMQEAAQRRGVPLIEDAAQALGSRYRGRALGAWGAAGCVSFHATKIVTCGEGGLLATNDDGLAEQAAIAREYGTNRAAFRAGAADHYEWVGPGTSALLAEPLAALLLAQLDRLEETLRRREAIAERYLAALGPVAAERGVALPARMPQLRRNWHVFFLRLPTRVGAQAVMDFLRSRGVESRPHFRPLHHSAYARAAGWDAPALPITERVATQLVRLPIHPALHDAQVARVIRVVQDALLNLPLS